MLKPCRTSYPKHQPKQTPTCEPETYKYKDNHDNKLEILGCILNIIFLEFSFSLLRKSKLQTNFTDES